MMVCFVVVFFKHHPLIFLPFHTQKKSQVWWFRNVTVNISRRHAAPYFSQQPTALVCPRLMEVGPNNSSLFLSGFLVSSPNYPEDRSSSADKLKRLTLHVFSTQHGGLWAIHHLHPTLATLHRQSQGTFCSACHNKHIFSHSPPPPLPWVCCVTVCKLRRHITFTSLARNDPREVLLKESLAGETLSILILSVTVMLVSFTFTIVSRIVILVNNNVG